MEVDRKVREKGRHYTAISKKLDFLVLLLNLYYDGGLVQDKARRKIDREEEPVQEN